MLPDVVTLGPLAFPLERLLAVGLIWAFLTGSLRLVRKEDRRARRTPWLALGTGIVAARMSFVAAHWEAYRPDPASVAYLWQGGFEPVAGIVAAAAILVIGMKSVRKAAGSLLLLAFASGLWFGYLQLEAQRPRPSFPEGIALADLNGRPFSPGDLRGRPFVVNLWASWCGPCRREMPMFVDVASRTPDVRVLLVNQGEDRRLIQDFLEDEGLPAGNILSDRGATLMRLTGSSGLPTTLFVRADGRIEEAHMGEMSRAALLQGMEDLRRR
ncbi:TlpA disulfide reductase family protein [Sphingosinicella rhizophila]|uniref:TlpA disulfide reductase family protein n=1 Tax=Sphingosinicella rhizophila TaxID=3050082 RepID=A0ABU3Q6W1_9SPHN|nr:TlpA disulfide reductase family protein [Sphingosinicella sp. GR2756]MDT9599131.1 TlpA disulfide reductase family protein [Sphingosinicella sp. GR2756]